MAMPCGTYRKDDGLSFDIGPPDTFTFRGAAQPMRSHGDGSFTISWEWGEPTFVLQPDGATLLENGVHAFRLQPPPAAVVATVEQRCSFRDTGSLVMHGCVPPASVAAALRCATVQAAIAKASPAQWAEGGGNEAALLELAAPVWPTVRALLGDDTPLPSWAQVAV